MEIQGLEFLAVFWASWTLLGLVTSYILTILNGHAESYLLYISGTGDYFPESVVFTVVLLFSAILDAILLYCIYRYYIIRSSKLHHHFPHVQYTILALGWIACVGTTLVAIFPAETHPLPHRTAAAVSFLGEVVRITWQTVLLHRLSFTNQHMYHLRICISIILIICAIAFTSSRVIQWQFCSSSMCLQISEETSIITEWIGALGIIVYNLTYYTDLQHLVFKWQWDFKVDWLFIRDRQQCCLAFQHLPLVGYEKTLINHHPLH